MAPQLQKQDIAINLNRASIYSFLSRIYLKEMTSEQVSELKSKGEALLPGLPLSSHDEGVDASRMRSGLALIRHYLKSTAPGAVKDVQLDLAEDYAGVLLGVKGRIPHPSESAYLAGGKIMGRPYREVRRLYQTAGLVADPEFTEPEDHVATELSFMAYLAKETSTAIGKGDKDFAAKLLQQQIDFQNMHLLRWVPKLCDDIVEIGRTDFYRGAAKITKGFLAMDCSLVKNLAGSYAMKRP